MNIFEKKISALIVFGLTLVFSFVLVSTTQAGNLDEASTTLTTTYGGRDAYYSVSFFVTSSVEVGAQLRLIWPAGYTLTTVASSSIGTSLTLAAGVVASSTVSGQEITLWLADGAVAVASDTLHFSSIGPVKSPYTGGTLNLGVETRTLANEISDAASTTTTRAVTIVAAPTELPKPTSRKTSGPPSSQITSPAVGEQISLQTKNILIEGTASDLGVYNVSKVEVSVNGGTTWQTATLTKVSASNYKWEYNWEIPGAGTYNIKSRANDTSSNEEIPGKGITLDISAGGAAPTKPVSEMTVSELQAKINELRQTLIGLLQKLVQLLTQQLQGLIQ